MAFNFPNSPADGAIYSPGAGLPVYTWSASRGAWERTSGGLSAGVYIGDNPPANPVQGQLWWESDSGNTFIYYNDGNSSQWIQFNTGLPPVIPVTPAGKVDWFAMQTPPTGWLKANGAAVLRSTYGTLDLAIYCGDANNAAANFGYHCTDPANPSTTRSTTGLYLALPELRSEFPRGWDDGRGIDSGRVFGSAQAGSVESHSHTQQGSFNSGTASANHNHQSGVVNTGAIDGNAGYGMGVVGGYANRVTIAGLNAAVLTSDAGASHLHATTISGQTANTGGTETRGRNTALLACIKY